MKKKYKMLLEFVKKQETEDGSIGLRESGLFMQDIAKIAKKYNFDCFCKGYPKEKVDYIPTGKDFEIKTVEDIADISEQQFEFFIEDLRNYCKFQKELVAFNKIIPGIIQKEKAGFTWQDTGLNESKIQATFTNNIS